MFQHCPATMGEPCTFVNEHCSTCNRAKTNTKVANLGASLTDSLHPSALVGDLLEDEKLGDLPGTAASFTAATDLGDTVQHGPTLGDFAFHERRSELVSTISTAFANLSPSLVNLDLGGAFSRGIAADQFKEFLMALSSNKKNPLLAQLTACQQALQPSNLVPDPAHLDQEQRLGDLVMNAMAAQLCINRANAPTMEELIAKAVKDADEKQDEEVEQNA